MLCFSIVLWLRCLGESAPKNGRVRRIGCLRCRQNLQHACARERFGSQNRQKLAASEHFWKLNSVKFAPRLRARAIWKSKSLKTGMAGALFEVQAAKICTTPARAIWKQNREKLTASGHFWKLKSPIVAPRCARDRFGSPNHSKSLKHQGLGPLLDQSAFRVAGAGVWTHCKIRGGRRGLWGLQKHWQAWWIWRGSETMLFAWQA